MTHTPFLYFSHLPFFSHCLIVVSEEMQKAVNHVKKDLFVGIALCFAGIGEGHFRTHKYLSQMLIIQGKGDTVGGSGIFKEFLMKGADLFFCDEIETYLLCVYPEKRERLLSSFPYGKAGETNRFLGVRNVDLQAVGVLGSPVTRVFLPSTHLPNLRSMSTRSNRLRTFRFLPVLLDLP